jgi:hypothetical protein
MIMMMSSAFLLLASMLSMHLAAAAPMQNNGAGDADLNSMWDMYYGGANAPPPVEGRVGYLHQDGHFGRRNAPLSLEYRQGPPQQRQQQYLTSSSGYPSYPALLPPQYQGSANAHMYAPRPNQGGYGGQMHPNNQMMPSYHQSYSGQGHDQRLPPGRSGSYQPHPPQDQQPFRGPYRGNGGYAQPQLTYHPSQRNGGHEQRPLDRRPFVPSSSSSSVRIEEIEPSPSDDNYQGAVSVYL